MTDFDEKDRSLLRCTLKKSTSTAIALGKIAICTVAIVVFCAMIAAIWESICSLGINVYSLLVAIPWWIYAIVGSIGAILMHSFLWCIAREVTPEAYADKRVNGIVDIMSLASLFGCIAVPVLMGIISGVLTNDATLVFAAVALSFCAVGSLLMAAITAWDAPEKVGVIRENPSYIYKFVRFLPAYYFMVTDPKPAEEQQP
jgi:hypothetical protein